MAKTFNTTIVGPPLGFYCGIVGTWLSET